MIQSLSVKALYPLALAEGEGVGTAYEYFAKRLVLTRWLGKMTRPRTILIAGLPQKYGVSLDFYLLAQELNAALTVIDDRPDHIAKAQAAHRTAELTNQPIYQQVADLAAFDEALTATFDLVICSEVIQRLPSEARPRYVQAMHTAGTHAALFCPNADNQSHVGISGLSGLTLAQLKTLVPQPMRPISYIDLPPFPPGITRSEEQREQATSGRVEAIAMWGLGFYARLERFLPLALRRPYAHIVYALM